MNANRTVGYATNDKQLAYEVQKGAISNCYNEDGILCPVAVAFCNEWSGEEDCTLEAI